MKDPAGATNPFRAAAFAVIPYCTGDLHAGTQIQHYNSFDPTQATHHVGALNVDSYLRELARRYPQVRQVWVTGSSAGGYGATLHYAAFAQAFPHAQVDLLADCAPLVPPYGDRWSVMNTAWQTRMPPGCPSCTTLPEVMTDAVTRFPQGRLDLLEYNEDAIITLYFNYPSGELGGALNTMLTNTFAPSTNARSFILAGTTHTMLGSLQTLAGPPGSGLTLKEWVRRWASGDPSWASVGP